MNTLALLLNVPLFFLYLACLGLGLWLGYTLWGGDARRLELVQKKADVLARQAAARETAAAKTETP